MWFRPFCLHKSEDINYLKCRMEYTKIQMFFFFFLWFFRFHERVSHKLSVLATAGSNGGWLRLFAVVDLRLRSNHRQVHRFGAPQIERFLQTIRLNWRKEYYVASVVRVCPSDHWIGDQTLHLKRHHVDSVLLYLIKCQVSFSLLDLVDLCTP